MEGGNRILLVEDNAALRRSLEKFLKWAGYAFDSCSTAREALLLAAESRYDTVIAEYHLPDANGAVLLEKLMLTAPRLGAIILSQYDFQVIADELSRVSVGYFLKKPFDLVDIEAALSTACSKAVTACGVVDRETGVGFKGVPASTFK